MTLARRRPWRRGGSVVVVAAGVSPSAARPEAFRVKVPLKSDGDDLQKGAYHFEDESAGRRPVAVVARFKSPAEITGSQAGYRLQHDLAKVRKYQVGASC